MLSGNHGADTPKIHPNHTNSIGKRNHPPAVSSDPLIGPAAPGRLVWPSHSQEPKNAARLAREVALHWAKPKAQAPPWLRESFRRRRPTTSSLWAYTTDSAGRIVRAFTADPASIAALSGTLDQIVANLGDDETTQNKMLEEA